ncbi:uncharacterized protein LOC142986219 [Anticarsia gemmatalis]|uniref:uncharacterized protein LOC142986219 n=1 Tax=Anticarsia gemmatalis TaxID=129554 RepID=UPI003F75E678
MAMLRNRDRSSICLRGKLLQAVGVDDKWLDSEYLVLRLLTGCLDKRSRLRQILQVLRTCADCQSSFDQRCQDTLGRKVRFIDVLCIILTVALILILISEVYALLHRHRDDHGADRLHVFQCR